MTERITAARRVNIIEAMDGIFRPWFPLIDGVDTWANWKAILKAMDGLPMRTEEVTFFKSIAGDREPPTQRVSEFVAACARRTGKDAIASALGAFAAATFDRQDKLRPGERAQVLCLACDRDQAKIVLNYIRSYFRDIPALAAMVERETKDGFELNNGVDITVATNSFRAVRGKPILLVILDEVAFMASETSANPDVELYAALRPGMLTIPGSRMVIISSPYRRSGLLWERYKKAFGKNDDSTLVIQAAVRELNPTITQAQVDAEIAADPAKAVSEILGQFRDDISNHVSREAVEACVVQGRYELPPQHRLTYSAFCDPAGGGGGSGGDSMTLAITHCEDGVAIVDAVREVKSPFSPEAVVAEFAQLMKSYRISEVTGDRYAGSWPTERFAVHGIKYRPSERTKTQIYVDALAGINGARFQLLDHAKLISQLCALERKTTRGTGRDIVDHPPSQHDDVANAVCGSLLIADEPAYTSTTMSFYELERQSNPENSPLDSADENYLEAEKAYRAGELRPKDVAWLLAERQRRARRARR
jgi:hypothetical protein